MIIVQSFGYGFFEVAPPNTHIEEDVRDSLRNPYVKDERWDWLRETNGTDPALKEFVLSTQVAPGAENAWQILDRLGMQAIWLLATQKEVVVSIGCWAGRHRSPALAEVLTDRLIGWGYRASVAHLSLSDALANKPLLYKR